jgi:hypothetical protein
VLLVVLLLVIDKARNTEDEHKNEEEQEGLTLSSKHALTPHRGQMTRTLTSAMRAGTVPA